MAAREPTKRPAPPSRRHVRPRPAGPGPPRRILTAVDDYRAADILTDEAGSAAADLAAQVERLGARLEAAERETVLLSEHLTSRGALIGTLHAEATRLRVELEAVRFELASGLRELAEARAGSEARSYETDELRARFESERRLAAERSAEADALSGRLEALESELRMLRDETVILRDQAASLRVELAAAQADRAAHADRAAQLEHAARASAISTGASQPVGDGADVAAGERAEQALERLQQESGALRDLVTVTEVTRDAYARHLKSVATSGPGRIAYRWVRFRQQHPRAARLMRAPFVGAWMLLTLRWPYWLRQHPLFDRDWYIETNRDLAASRLRPWWHYVRHGSREGRAPNRYFDREWYLRTYPDVRMVGMDPLDHYFRHGAWEGRDPSPRFSTDWYFANHTDVAAMGVNPLLYFIRHGIAQGHQPRPQASGASRSPATFTGAAAFPATSPGAATAVQLSAAQPLAAQPAPAVGDTRPAPRRDVGRIRKVVRSTLPSGARVGVVADGDRELLSIPDMEVTPIPRAADGRMAGDVPRNDLSAIAHVESVRVAHIDYLVVPEPSLWLTMVPGLRRHLEARYAVVGQAGASATIFDVRVPATGTGRGSATDLRATLRSVRERLRREPSLLDWDSGMDVSAELPGASVFSPPPGTRDDLPYADSSVDAVLLRDPDPARKAEAKRVGSLAMISLPSHPGAREASVEWLSDASATAAASASVIVPTYNDVSLLRTCLRTLDETVPAWLDVEVIVADDGSDAAYHGDVDALVAAYPRVRLVRSATNGGYIAAASAGAAAATKDVLIFLNNDTVLLPGWIEPLLDTLRDRPEVGVVGGMLLYPDGRLQEAGCAIFRDGSATKIGYRESDPTLSYYAHPRPVDYVSGALLATPRALFEELGGLDRAFGFGYYEDGDYCFRARRAGREVIYQPGSVVVHVEGGTAGVDLSRGAKRFQATNQALFVDRWKDELERHHARPEPMDIHASRDLVIRGRTQPFAR